MRAKFAGSPMRQPRIKEAKMSDVNNPVPAPRLSERMPHAKAKLGYFAYIAKRLARDLGDVQLDSEHDQVVNALIANLAQSVTLAESLR
jgi:hypothetical protein